MSSPWSDEHGGPNGPVDAVCNQKGGAGKTTTAVSLAAELARRGRRVRLIDMDPQAGSATAWLPPQWNDAPPERRYDLSHVLLKQCSLDEATWPTTVPGLSLVPSFQTMRRWVNDRPPAADMAMRRAIERGSVQDATVLDLPPDLGLLTIAGLTAAGRLAIPLRAGGLDMKGVAELNQTVGVVREDLNPDLYVAAVLLCGKLESNLTGQVYDRLKDDYPDAISMKIRHTVRVGEAQFYEQPLHVYAPDATATEDYKELTDRFYPQYVEVAA